MFYLGEPLVYNYVILTFILNMLSLRNRLLFINNEKPDQYVYPRRLVKTLTVSINFCRRATKTLY